METQNIYNALKNCDDQQMEIEIIFLLSCIKTTLKLNGDAFYIHN